MITIELEKWEVSETRAAKVILAANLHLNNFIWVKRNQLKMFRYREMCNLTFTCLDAVLSDNIFPSVHPYIPFFGGGCLSGFSYL